MSEQEPHIGRYRFSRSLALGWGLFGLLAISAALGLIGASRIHWVPRWLGGAAPYLFAAFLALFAVYRFALVRARRYPAGRALLQVGMGVIFLALLFVGRTPRAGVTNRPIEALLAHGEPDVRALAAETLRYRSDGLAHARALVNAIDDSSPEVRDEALRSLRFLAGGDFGGSGSDAQERWSRWLDQIQAPRIGPAGETPPP